MPKLGEKVFQLNPLVCRDRDACKLAQVIGEFIAKIYFVPPEESVLSQNRHCVRSPLQKELRNHSISRDASKQEYPALPVLLSV